MDQANLVDPAKMVLMVPQEDLASQEAQDPLDLKANPARLVSLAAQAQLDQLGPLALLDNLVNLEALVLLVSLAALAPSAL